MGGSETTVACDDHWCSGCCSQTMSWEGGLQSLRRRRTVRYFYSFDVSFSHSSLGSTSSDHKIVGVTTRSKVRSYANCPHVYFALYPQWSSTDHILHTKPENAL